MDREDFDAQVVKIAALAEPIRRALYRYVIAQPEPVSREQAAAGVGVAHHAAKFHLDRLESDGLLEAEYRRPEGRGGPGAGRPAKVYRRAARDVAVALPERRYGLAGRILAEAVTTAQRTGAPVADTFNTAARAAGRTLGEQARRELAGRPPGTAPLRVAAEVLAAGGYEPRRTADGITLANCPFHDLAVEYTDLVCGMNLDLIDAMLDALGAAGTHARLAPAPGRCCVTIDAPSATAEG